MEKRYLIRKNKLPAIVQELWEDGSRLTDSSARLHEEQIRLVQSLQDKIMKLEGKIAMLSEKD